MNRLRAQGRCRCLMPNVFVLAVRGVWADRDRILHDRQRALAMRSPLRQLWLRFHGLVLAIHLGAAGAEAATDGQRGSALGILTTTEPIQAEGFVTIDLEGRPLRQPGYHGKVVVLISWATSCIACREMLRGVERPYQTFKALGLVVLAVNSQEKHEVVRAFEQDVTVTFPIVLDPKGSIVPASPIRGLPAPASSIGTRSSSGAPSVPERETARKAMRLSEPSWGKHCKLKPEAEMRFER